jgi:ech hydrogenase subunit D
MDSGKHFELITRERLIEVVNAMRQREFRLVQISATRLPNELELTYSFDRDGALLNLRVLIPANEARVPSISSVYWCAFLYENELHDLFSLQVEGMAVDFQGHLYQTAVPFPFGSTKPPLKPASPAAVPASTL